MSVDQALIDVAIASLEDAKRDVLAAEAELETLFKEIRVAPRAEKTAISQVLEGALQRLRSGRMKVEEAESTLIAARRKA